jgi:hypothetical protein
VFNVLLLARLSISSFRHDIVLIKLHKTMLIGFIILGLDNLVHILCKLKYNLVLLISLGLLFHQIKLKIEAIGMIKF